MAQEGNIYAQARNHVLQEHASRMRGSTSGLVLVVFTEPLTDVAENALEKSFEAIGFGTECTTYADLTGLSPEEAFALVEGVDPLALVATDETAAQLCAQAVRQPFPPSCKLRLFGREARAFANLNGMFGSEAGKQTVWHLLKSLR